MIYKKHSLIFRIYLILALINVLYSIYIRMTTGVDYNKLANYIVNFSQFKLSFLTIFFGISSLIIIISSIIFLVISHKKKLPTYFRVYPIYNLSWNTIWFFLVPIYVCYSNPVNCLSSLNHLYKFEFIFNIAEIVLISYSLSKIMVRKVDFINFN